MNLNSAYNYDNFNTRNFVNIKNTNTMALFHKNMGSPASDSVPVSMLVRQEMREWQWHQLDCVGLQIICISQVNTSISALGLFVNIMDDLFCSNKLSEAGLMMH